MFKRVPYSWRKTNIHFLINVLEHPEFQSGRYNVNFIEEHPELFELKPARDRGTRLLRYIADVTINGYSGAGPQSGSLTLNQFKCHLL